MEVFLLLLACSSFSESFFKIAMRSRILLIFICVFGSIFGQEVKVLKENLSPKTRIYWDASNKHVQGVGCYFRSEASPNTTEKHGKWLFYSYDGILEEEANYYRGRLHGKRVFYDEQKRVKQESYYKFNVPDSIYREFAPDGKILVRGRFEL